MLNRATAQLRGVFMTMKRSKKNIDYNELIREPDLKHNIGIVKEHIAKAQIPCLSDAIVRRQRGGQYVIKALHEEITRKGLMDPTTRRLNDPSEYKWKLKCIAHKDGRPPQPGDKISYVVHTATTYQGIPVSNTIIQDLAREGISLKQIRDYVLDDDCCFTCTFDPALYFLTQFGVHYDTGQMLAPINKDRDCTGINARFVEVFDDNDAIAASNASNASDKKGK